MTEKKARKPQPKFVVWSDSGYGGRRTMIVSAANAEAAARKLQREYYGSANVTVTVAPLTDIRKFKIESVLKVTERKVNDA